MIDSAGLSALLDEEQRRFSVRDANLLTRIHEQLRHYLATLNVIRDRYFDLCKEYGAKTRSFVGGLASKPPVINQEWLTELEDLAFRLRLEIESFYLFGKILLDWLARFIEFYFGAERRLSLDSHDDLTKRVERYARAKGLNLPTEMLGACKGLKSTLSDFRDYEVAHQKSPRVGPAFNTTFDGRVRLVYSRMFPTENDRRAETRPLDELLAELESYLSLIVDIVRRNQAKTALKVAPR